VLSALALELLDAVQPDRAFTIDPIHLARVGGAISLMDDPQSLITAVDDCMRVALVLRDQRGAPASALAIEKTLVAALITRNQRRGELARISEAERSRTVEYRRFTETRPVLNAPHVEKRKK
jgi:hypothetical protein